MSFAEFKKFADEVASQIDLRSVLQSAFNDLVTGVIDLSRDADHPVTRDEIREYFLDEVLAPETESADRWSALLRDLISRSQVVDPGKQIYKTMSLGAPQSDFSSALQDAVKSALDREKSQKKK